MLSLRAHLTVLLVAACGPTLPSSTEGDDETSPSTGSTAGATTTTTSTTTSVEPTTGGVGSTGEQGSGFVDPPDMGSSFIAPFDGGGCAVDPDGALRCSMCSLWVQDCREGHKCSPYSSAGDNSWDAHKCVPLDPNPDHVGEPCTVVGGGVSGNDSCDIESMCWNVDAETSMGVCVPFCDGNPDEPICPRGTHCLNSNDGVLTICLPMCDPLVQDCPGDDVCVPDPLDMNEFLCVLDASGEEGQAFDTCEYANACDKGLMCAYPGLASECDPEAAGCCLPFCDVAAPDCPGAMQECLPWFEMDQAPPGLENVGICGIPQ